MKTYIKLVGVIFLLLATSLVNSSKEGDEITEDKTIRSNNLKIFMPSHEWREIDSGETVFAGLHYRMNLESGKKEAKLLDGNDGKEYYATVQKYLNKQLIESLEGVGNKESGKSQTKEDNFQVTLVNEENHEDAKLTFTPEKLAEIKQIVRNKKNKKSFMNDLKEIDDSLFKDPRVAALEEAMAELQRGSKVNAIEKETKNNFRSYEQLKEELKDLNLEVEDEQSQVSKMVTLYTSTDNEEEKIRLLTDLEYLLHAVDSAKVFIDAGGLTSVVALSLNSSNCNIRLLCCRIVTACTQNYGYGQREAVKAGVMDLLVEKLSDHQLNVSLSSLTALGSLVSHYKEAQKHLFTSYSHQLSSIMRSGEVSRMPLRVKLMTLLSDIISTSNHEEIERRDLMLLMNDMEWCDQLSDLLTHTYQTHFSLSSPHPSTPSPQSLEMLQKVLQALHNSKQLCPLRLVKTAPVLGQMSAILKQLTSTHSDMEEYYSTIRDTIDSLLLQIPQEIIMS